MNNTEIKKLLSQDLSDKDWIGVVVDNDDKELQFRCKVKVFGLFDDLETDAIPWAFPANKKIFAGGEGGYGEGSVPKVGTLVKVRFANGDLYAPEYYAIQNVNTALQAEIAEDYGPGTHVLLFDEDEELKILYTPGTGIKIHLKDSHITINPDKSITIEHAESKSIIELAGDTCNVVTSNKVEIVASNEISMTAKECTLNGTQKTVLGPDGNFSAVAAEPLWAFLKSLAAAVDAKWPPSPGVNSAAAEAAEKASTSQNNKISL